MTEESPIRTTVFFDPINDAVKQALAEDAEDFEAFDTREQEADYVFEDVVKELKRRGKI